MNKDKEIFQCNCCGTIYKVSGKYKPRGDDIYRRLWCQQCGDYTWQLHCGDNEDEIYELYNLNMDKNYY